MRVTGDGGEVSAAAEKQRRMLPRCKECSPPHLFSLAVLAWVVVFGLSARDLWALCPAALGGGGFTWKGFGRLRNK